MHLCGTLDIVLALLFASQTSAFSALLGRQFDPRWGCHLANDPRLPTATASRALLAPLQCKPAATSGLPLPRAELLPSFKKGREFVEKNDCTERAPPTIDATDDFIHRPENQATVDRDRQGQVCFAC